jgi:AcrR family transcriptional regulator
MVGVYIVSIKSTEPARSAGTRGVIIAACRAVLEAGRGLSMGAVAARARVSRQAVYLHFASRAELLEAVVDEVMAPLATRLRAALQTEDPDEALAIFLDVALHQARHHGKLARAVRDAVAGDPDVKRAWSRRNGRERAATRISELFARAHRLRAGLDVRSAADGLQAFVTPDLVDGLLAAMNADDARATLERAVRGALLRERAVKPGASASKAAPRS